MYDTNRLLKNVMGLWIVQQCRATWASQGESLSYENLTGLAREAPMLQSFIYPDSKAYLLPGDHPGIIQQYCAQTGQPVPSSRGAVIRCVLESLALRYRDVIESLAGCADLQVSTIHILGGGSQNNLLNQMTADATGLPVVAGPVEATVMGNALVQLITLGELKDLREARQLIARFDALKHFEPVHTDQWDAAYDRYTRHKTNGY